MARTLSVARARIPPRRRRRRQILLVSLLLPENPSSAVGVKQGAATDGGVAFEHETTGEPVSRRTRSRRRAAAAIGRLPEEIMLFEIFVHLPARDILRCRVVCRSWRRLASVPDFLLAHHRRQPSLPLVQLYGGIQRASTKAGLPISGNGPGRGLNDYDGFELNASCDGLLLLSRSGGRFSICNPITRQCAPLPRLTAEGRRSNIKIAALYLYPPTGEYRIMYWRGSHHAEAAACYILTVGRRGSPRCIGVPSDTIAIRKAKMTENGVTPINVSPPVVLGGCLHWEPGWLDYDANDIVVFDTVVESFRSMCCPPSATSCCTHLCEMEGLIGFSCLDDERTVVRIWVLEDYKREAWSFKYHVKFPVESFCRNIYTQHLILSHKGDVLVYNTYARYMFRCDSTGKLLKKFSWEPELQRRLNIIEHRLKESLVEQEYFTKQGAHQPFLFQTL